MLFQLVIGASMIVVSILTQAVFVSIATRVLSRKKNDFRSAQECIVVVSAVTLWMLVSIAIVVWLWAAVLIALGAFTTMEPALYFSIVSFTTLGYGDIVLPDDLRLLSGLIATNGLVLFGLATAFLIDLLLQIRDTD